MRLRDLLLLALEDPGAALGILRAFGLLSAGALYERLRAGAGQGRSRRALTGLLSLVVLLAGTAAPARAERMHLREPLERRGFELIAQKGGIKVYKHRYDRNIRLGADARIDAPVDVVLRALLDYRGQVGKIDRLSESRVLRRGDGWLEVYQRLNLPVISDRDFTLRVTWGQTGDVTWIDYHALKGHGPPPRDGIVRVSYHEGSWQLRPLRGGRACRIRFMVSIDLSGWLPRWLARSGSGKEIPALIEAIRKMVAKP